MSVTINGLDEVIESIESVGDPDRIRQALVTSCALVERSAKQKAIKGTGALRRSITSKIEEGSGDIKGIVYTPLEYAPYVEYGTGLFAENNGGRKDVPWNYQDDEGNWHTTSGMKPQPFLRPAFDENREKILRLIKEALTND